MAFDRTYPITGSTPWNTLYAGLRAQFTALDDLTDNEIAWTNMTLTSGWGQYLDGDPYYVPRYCKDGMGFVHLRGAVDVDTGASPSQIITTLPAACWPAKTCVFHLAYDSSATTYTYFFVNTSGEIRVDLTPASSDLVRFNVCYYHVGR
jgi:hypothetical protein